MMKHADHLTPSHFGEANDSKINRKQRHRKQCETRDERGIYHSNRAKNTDIQACGLFVLLLNFAKVFMQLCTFLSFIVQKANVAWLIDACSYLICGNVYQMPGVPKENKSFQCD